ncbi:MAG TPA: YlxR family protein [Trueperaceae bacterium]|nr:YlxR family protein [Trueperaceae bacterium]
MASSTSKHVPLRRCVLCRASLPKAELIRLVRSGEGGFELDPAGRAGGRGTWVCRSCAQDPTEKRLRQAFRGQAARVGELLTLAVGVTPTAALAEGIGTEA